MSRREAPAERNHEGRQHDIANQPRDNGSRGDDGLAPPQGPSAFKLKNKRSITFSRTPTKPTKSAPAWPPRLSSYEILVSILITRRVKP